MSRLDEPVHRYVERFARPRPAPRLYQDLHPVFAFEPGQRRGCGTEDSHLSLVSGFAQMPRKFFGELSRRLEFLVMNQNVYQNAEGRIAHRTTEFHFAAIEFFVALRTGALHRVMFGMISLNQHTTGTAAATRAARDLS